MKEELETLLSEVKSDGLTKRQRQGMMLLILQKVQRKFGYIPQELVPRIADYLGVPASRIMGVATFYSAFKFTPAAKNNITVCCGTACHVRGSARLLNELSQKLGIGAGGTTSDLNFSLDTIACFGSCSLAPVVVINEKVQGRMNRTKLLKRIDQLVKETSATKIEAA